MPEEKKKRGRPPSNKSLLEKYPHAHFVILDEEMRTNPVFTLDNPHISKKAFLEYYGIIPKTVQELADEAEMNKTTFERCLREFKQKSKALGKPFDFEELEKERAAKAALLLQRANKLYQRSKPEAIEAPSPKPETKSIPPDQKTEKVESAGFTQKSQALQREINIKQLEEKRRKEAEEIEAMKRANERYFKERELWELREQKHFESRKRRRKTYYQQNRAGGY